MTVKANAERCKHSEPDSHTHSHMLLSTYCKLVYNTASTYQNAELTVVVDSYDNLYSCVANGYISVFSLFNC